MVSKLCGYCQKPVPGGDHPQEYSVIWEKEKSLTWVHKECLEEWHKQSPPEFPNRMVQKSFVGLTVPSPDN